MLVANYISKLKGKGSGYWIRLAIFVLLGTLAASWVGNWSIWIDARFKIYQALQSMLPGRGPYVQNTFLILIHDEDYWEGKLDQRVPIKRDYLADLVDALAKDNVGIIVLDFDLRSPMPSGAPAGSDKYSDETKKLAQQFKMRQEIGS